ncbi:YkgJ family cysteine cluster protein [Myxococcota bacterium]|nr:YkgJ family cysteine cluster protein [Myxococcota bacterium]
MAIAPGYYDCRACGACCVNPSANRAEGFQHYVEIEPTSVLLVRKDLKKKLVVLDEEGTPHLRLTSDGRCMALRGAIGKAADCSIYHHRPDPCRRVEAGSRLCLDYRRDAGLGP